jgi:signal transduction histidine kinase
MANSVMIGGRATDQTGGAISLLDLPVTSWQRRSAFAVASVLLLGFAILAPFGGVPLPQMVAFIPSFDTAIFVTDFITSVMLFAQFSIFRTRAILVLANGYLFASLFVLPHAVSWPAAFSPTGLLGGGLQNTAWLYVFWHTGFPAALLIYVWLRDEKHAKRITEASTSFAIRWSVAILCSLAFGLLWLASRGDEYLPELSLDRTNFTWLLRLLFAFMALSCMTALALLWSRRRSVLDYWLMVAALALIIELMFVGVLSSARYSLGSYAGRVFSLVTSTVVLVVLLGETTRLYVRVARSNFLLQRERDNKLMNLQAVVASISHEVKQPLAAIAANGSAALRFLKHAPPNLEEVRFSLDDMVSATFRVNQVLDDIRTLFGKAADVREPLDVNELVLGALRVLRAELKAQDVTTYVELASELPLVMGNRGQLQEVILNLVHNAVEAMDAVGVDRRVLKVRTEQNGSKSIFVEVEDSGPGIDPEMLSTLFEAFVTTKPKGMGLGLAISRMITERHEGQLSVSSAHPQGCIFRIALPQKNLPLNGTHGLGLDGL